MIDFDYWFDNLASASELIASEDALQRAWIHGDATVTSAYNVDELLEQLLGDLRVHEEIRRFDGRLSKMGALSAVVVFAQALLDAEAAIRDDPRLEDPAKLLPSTVWSKVRGAARSVVQLPAVQARR